MRTTVTLPDHLLVEAKKVAVERRLSLTRLLEESLRRYLAQERAERRNKPALRPLPVIEGAHLVAGVDLDDTSALWDV